MQAGFNKVTPSREKTFFTISVETLSFEKCSCLSSSSACCFFLAYIKWWVEEAVIFAALQTATSGAACNATSFILNAIFLKRWSQKHHVVLKLKRERRLPGMDEKN